jgi:hypothetical protein
MLNGICLIRSSIETQVWVVFGLGDDIMSRDDGFDFAECYVVRPSR